MEGLILPVTFDQAALASIKSNNYFLGFLLGGTAYMSLSKLMKKEGMGLSNASWNVLSSIAGVTIGYMVYKEKLTEKKKIGIALGAIGLYLMNGAD